MTALVVLAAAIAAGTVNGGVSAAPRDAAADGRRFIVTFRDSVSDPHGVANEHAAHYGAEISTEYSHVIKGYAGTFKGGGLGEVVRDPRVESVELDGDVSVAAEPKASDLTVQSPLSTDYWGLDRINQTTGLDGRYTYSNTGAGVTAYILDTGIDYSHKEFLPGRATLGFDAVTAGGTGADCNGHGSHVAGIVGGVRAGVAKGVNLQSVRVLDCSGTGNWSTIIKGLDYVVGNHAAGTPAVANLSLAGNANSTVDQAVNNLIADGVTVVIAAGNGNFLGLAQDACKTSPARVPAAITVSATDITDVKASFANYGPCVDWFAPGVDIASAYWFNGQTDAYVRASGTSVAAPFTAGVVALYLQKFPMATPLDVRTALYAASTSGVVKRSSSTDPRLLFTNY